MTKRKHGKGTDSWEIIESKSNVVFCLVKKAFVLRFLFDLLYYQNSKSYVLRLCFWSHAVSVQDDCGSVGVLVPVR